MEQDLNASNGPEQETGEFGSRSQKESAWPELCLCLAVVAGALVWSLWPLLIAPNSNFPYTGDGMGHLTKVKYMADCLKDFKWPAWFPYWYNGSTLVQYYPPLAFFFLVPIQILFDNIMITFKLWVFASSFIGALGVWFICRRWMGNWVGIIGAVLYALQPFLLRSMLMQGVIAQGPIIALTPWLLLATLLFLERQTAFRWISVSVLISLLILSHAMHAFIICIGMLYIVGLLLLIRKISFKDFFLWGWAIVVGLGLVAFWWLPGVTHLEMAGLPVTYGTGTAREVYTAGLDWFHPAIRRSVAVYYFPPTMLAFAVFTVLFLRKPVNPESTLPSGAAAARLLDIRSLILGLLFALLGTVALAFGHKIPAYNYIPMSKYFFPGRILTFSSLLATLLCAILISQIALKANSLLRRIISGLLITVIVLIIMLDINPRYANMKTLPYKGIQSAFSMLPSVSEPFANGRFGWVCPMGAEITYFPMLKNWNMTLGWNLEGSIHTYTLLRDNIGLSTGHPEYTIKNLLHWNTRAVVVDRDYPELQSRLLDYGFKELQTGGRNTLFFNSRPSSYFMRSNWNAMVIGLSSPGMEISFPWMVEGYSDYLEDYPDNYLDIFKLIYLVDPQIRDFNRFQQMIEDLAARGHMVVVEMGRSETRPLLDVYPYLVTIEPGARLLAAQGSPLQQAVPLTPDINTQVASLGNLDGVWMEMVLEDQKTPVIGYKNVKGNKVYFVGLGLSQQLQTSSKWEGGVNAESNNDRQINSLLDHFMDLAHPNKNIVPISFPVKETNWRHDGFSFSYDSKQNIPVQVSVTYTPRWKATIDGKPWPLYNTENLILLKLPAGQHRVNIKYGMSWVGWAGIGISAASLLLMLFSAFQLEVFLNWSKNLGKSLLLSITDND